MNNDDGKIHTWYLLVTPVTAQVWNFQLSVKKIKINVKNTAQLSTFWHNFTLNMRLCKQDWALWPSVVLLSKGLHLLLSWWHTHPVPRSFFFGAHPPEHALPRPARNCSILRNGPPHPKHPWLKPIHLLEEIYFRSHPPLEHCSQGSGEVLMLFQ